MPYPSFFTNISCDTLTAVSVWREENLIGGETPSHYCSDGGCLFSEYKKIKKQVSNNRYRNWFYGGIRRAVDQFQYCQN